MAFGLPIRNQQSARWQRFHGVQAAELIDGALDGQLLVAAVNLDALERQKIRQFAQAAFVAGGQHGEGAARVRAFVGDDRPAVGEEIGLDGHRVVLQRFEVRPAGEQLMVDRFAVTEDGAIRATHPVFGDAGLLEEEADGTAHLRPGIAISGVPVVVPFAGVIQPALTVEIGGLAAGENVLPLVGAGREVGVDRLAGGGEEEGILGTHFVGVEEIERMPAAGSFDTAAGFRVDAQDPVAVQIEVVVVGAAVGPITGMQQSLVVDVREGAAVFGGLVAETVAAVGVHQRVDQDHHLVEHGQHLGVGGSHQVVDERQGRIGARGFIAVNGVGKPRHRWQLLHQAVALGDRKRPRVGEFFHAAADLLEPRDIGRR